jgi:hypothetical protein
MLAAAAKVEGTRVLVVVGRTLLNDILRVLHFDQGPAACQVIITCYKRAYVTYRTVLDGTCV